MNVPTSDAELVLDACSELAEGPSWDAATGLLIWVDITHSLVHRFDPATGRDEAIDVGKHVGAAVPRASGGLALALADGFGILDTYTGRVEMIAQVEAENPLNRMNDGKCDPSGRFWAGTMAYDSRVGAGALYRLETDGRVSKVVVGVTISNGLGWSLDQRYMYYIDSGSDGVDVFDYDATTGAVTRRRRLIEIAARTGTPDGMTVDADGYLWVALWDGWAVHRYAPDGTLDRVVRVPVARVSSCTFGGDDLGDLYITTAWENLSAEARAAQPHAGGIFRARPGVTGLPTNVCKG